MKRPTRPDVKQPPAWTWASQEILTQSRGRPASLWRRRMGPHTIPRS